jgi:AraC-like DNA-binding protein
MPDSIPKMLLMLYNDIDCHCKDISVPTNINKVFHNHDGYEVFLLLDGDVEYYTENNFVKLMRGDMLFINPYVFHHVHLLDNNCYDRVVLNLRSSVITALSSVRTDLSAIFHKSSSQEINLVHLSEPELEHFVAMAKELESVLYASDDFFGKDILSESLIKQILVSLNRFSPADPDYLTNKKTPSLILDTFAYLEAHLTEEDFSVKKLADAVHHNSSYLNRCFKKVTGTSLQQYITAKKVALSQEYLRKGYSPCDACYSAGFHNYSNFSRIFSLQTGISPKQYQLMNQNH